LRETWGVCRSNPSLYCASRGWKLPCCLQNMVTRLHVIWRPCVTPEGLQTPSDSYGVRLQILMRPQPPPAVEQGQFKTMSMHGGT